MPGPLALPTSSGQAQGPGRHLMERENMDSEPRC